MKKFGGTRYNSQWDASTWLIIGIVVVCCIWPVFLDDGIWPVVISCVMLAFLLVLLKSIYYKIDGNNLVVYQFFVSTVYPIDKIESVLPTTSVLSSPATSISNRLAIKFTDKKVLKSSTPLIISPAHQHDFIAHLLTLNPNIKH